MNDLTNSETRRLLIEAAKRAAAKQGYAMKRLPGRGLANIWDVTKDGKTSTACIRTTQDRWFAFPPLDGGTRFKTLDDVDLVFVSAVNDQQNPTKAQVYLFEADEVRKRFREAYEARAEASRRGQPDGYGMWIGLDVDKRDTVSSVGSGIAQAFPAVAEYPLLELSKEAASGTTAEEEGDDYSGFVAEPTAEFTNIGDVMSFARGQIARLAKVGPNQVKLQLNIEY